jgi:uncharacterized membrane protein
VTIVFALLGLLVGAAFAEWAGAIAGLFVGGLCGEVMALKDRLRKLERTSQQSVTGQAQAPQTFTQPTADRVTASPVEPPRAATRESIAAVSESPSIPPVAVASASTAAPVAAPISPATTTPPKRPASPRVVHPELPLVRWVREFFTGGNAVVRISIVVLFFGVSFLLQYAVEHNRLPIEFRLFGAAALALVFLVIGWRLRTRRSGFALALQGGATGVLYLTIFAALRLYGVLPPALAFTLLIIIVALSAMLAVLQNSVWLAVLGISGGFLAPILTSTGQGNHVMLFSFYAVLNLGILGIAWYKSWRALNVLGLLFTFVIGIVWGVLRYRPELFATTEPFLVLFFLFYVAIAVLFASRQPPELKGYVDGTLVFGVPVTAFAVQSALLRDQPYALSASAMAVAMLYLGLAWTLWRKSTDGRDNWRLLVEAFIALSITFATLAIPLALNGRWSAATWALEGAALIWVGCRQSRMLPRVAGALLQFAAAFMLWRDSNYLFEGWPLLNSTFLGAGLVAAAGVFSSHLLYRYADRLHEMERPFAAIAFWWGWLWWLAVGLGEIERSVYIDNDARAALLFVSFTCVLASFLYKQLTIPTARWAALALLPAMVLFSFVDGSDVAHPFAELGWLVWPLAWMAWYWALRRHEGEPQSLVAISAHVASYWLLLVLVAWECSWLVHYAIAGADVWRSIVVALIPAVALLAAGWLERTVRWPFAVHAKAYTQFAHTGLAGFLVLWSLAAAAHAGAAYPLPYLPLFNPLDIAQAFVLLALVTWWKRFAVGQSLKSALTARDGWLILGAIVFIWLNAVLLRTVHHWAGVPYNFFYLWNSTVVQAALSIFWTLLALALVWTAARRAWRIVWFVGAGLLAVELCKLFFVDLSNSGSVARIVSFMGVGVLGVLIGYVSPLPPSQQERTA